MLCKPYETEKKVFNKNYVLKGKVFNAHVTSCRILWFNIETNFRVWFSFSLKFTIWVISHEKIIFLNCRSIGCILWFLKSGASWLKPYFSNMVNFSHSNEVIIILFILIYLIIKSYKFPARVLYVQLIWPLSYHKFLYMFFFSSHHHHAWLLSVEICLNDS